MTDLGAPYSDPNAYPYSCPNSATPPPAPDAGDSGATVMGNALLSSSWRRNFSTTNPTQPKHNPSWAKDPWPWNVSPILLSSVGIAGGQQVSGASTGDVGAVVMRPQNQRPEPNLLLSNKLY